MSKLKLRFRVNSTTQSAMFAAMLCMLCPLAIPMGPIPVTIGVFAVLLTGIVLPWKRAAAAVAAYMLIGLVGLPVFSGGGSGFGVLVGPTGGYLWCYLPMAALVSIISGRGGRLRAAIGCLAAVLLCYLLGTLQFTQVMSCGWREALALCVYPFILFDVVKLLCAALLGVRIRNRLQNAGLL